ncbi:hypothetical protein B0T21DRAFT_454777 [Apiosordaria backusii]|uniref:COP9 signalosome complex subunit 6 n=1 Tax=Apiosordaria backusii TaxID=314023 RepID=A0AA40AAD5_9PEZI|nr:hypothetical protein B0T21DRAFT_454777 [Apiosordaria backusii]
MHQEGANELLSAQKSSDSGLQIILHPLPILEISDFITRGYQRNFKGAVVGGLLGQQNGRDITIEHSFSVKSVKEEDDGGVYELDQEWFRQRLDQMKLVHKSPELDLVGWYALVPKSGPTVQHLPIHRQISAVNESAVLLGFHLENMLSPMPGDPLPITIYESNMEAEGEDKEMKDSENPTNMVLRFRKLPYATETGEAEMIGMQFIREGAANASADDAQAETKNIAEQFEQKIAVTDGKGKRRAVMTSGSVSKNPASPSKGKGKEKDEPSSSEPQAQAPNPDINLTRSDSEYMAALQSKFNAIKMLKSRISLITTYLQRLPPAFTEGKQTTQEASDAARASGGQYTIPSNNILRHIQSLVANIDLVTPAEQAALRKEMLQEANDVKLISLISDLLTSVSEVKEAGKKSSALESTKPGKGPSGGGGFGGQGGDNNVDYDFTGSFDTAQLRGGGLPEFEAVGSMQQEFSGPSEALFNFSD